MDNSGLRYDPKRAKPAEPANPPRATTETGEASGSQSGVSEPKVEKAQGGSKGQPGHFQTDGSVTADTGIPT